MRTTNLFKMPNETRFEDIEATDNLHVIKAIGRVRQLGVRSEDKRTIINLCTEIALLKQEVERLKNILEPKEYEINYLKEKLKEVQIEDNVNEGQIGNQGQMSQETSVQENSVQTETLSQYIANYTQTNIRTKDQAVQATPERTDSCTELETKTVKSNEISRHFHMSTQAGVMLRHASSQTESIKRNSWSVECLERVQSTIDRRKQTSSESLSCQLPLIQTSSPKRRLRSSKRESERNEPMYPKSDYHKNCIPPRRKTKSWIS